MDILYTNSSDVGHWLLYYKIYKWTKKITCEIPKTEQLHLTQPSPEPGEVAARSKAGGGHSMQPLSKARKPSHAAS